MNIFSYEIASIIQCYLPEPHSSVLNGITWGIPLKKSLHVYEMFKKAGLLHLVVASGTNIAILSGTVLFFFQKLGKYISLLILLLIIGMYIYIVGFEAPIIRAAIMSIFSFVSLMFGRRSISLYVLFITAIIMVIFLPSLATSVSFLLSFSASLGIILFSGNNTEENNKRSLLSEIISVLKPSVSASLFTAPIIWFYFKQISFVAPLSNILISFIVAPVMFIGMILTIVGRVFPFIAQLVGLIAYGMVEYIIMIAEFTSRIPYGFVDFK